MPTDFKCCVCGASACRGVGVFHLQGKPGEWYCDAHWSQSEHGVSEAIERARSACEGADDETLEQGETQ